MGVLHESGHPEPWIIAMDCPPNRAAVLDDGARWAIEPRVSDFKSRGFRWEETKIEAPKRLDCLILIMALAMDGCVQARQDDARCHPTATEKKAREQSDPNHWSVRKAYRSALSWFKRGLRLLLRRAASALPLPKFFLGMET